MKKIFLTLGLALFAFAGVYAQETETETQTQDPQLEEGMPEEAAPEEGMLEEEADALQGKTRVTFEELPIAVQDAVTAAGFEEMEIVEAYEIEASATGDAQGEQTGEAPKNKYEVHVNKDNKTKVLTFDESGEKVKGKDKKDKW